MRFERVLALLVVMSLLAVSVFLVRSAQRSLLLLTAEKDVRVMSVSDDGIQVGTLPAGHTRQIVRCVDNKHYIRPVIEVEPGKFGFPEPFVKLSIHDTGVLSKPQFLGCGNY